MKTKIMIILMVLSLIMFAGCNDKDCITFNGQTACRGDVNYAQLSDLVKYQSEQPVRNFTTDPKVGCYINDVFVENCSIEVEVNG